MPNYVSVLSTLWLKHALNNAPHDLKGILLDIGCGQKPYVGLFRAQQHIGIDWPNSLHCQDVVDAFADAAHLPFADASFDMVLCTEVLEHLPEPHLAVNEMARVLKSGGTLVLSVPFLFHIHEQPWDYCRFTVYALRYLLEKNHFEVTTLISRGGTFTVGFDLLIRAWGAFLKLVLRRSGVSSRLFHIVMTAFVSWPQHAAARWGIFLAERAPTAVKYLDPSHSITLGYVVVAKRASDVRHRR